MSLLITTIATGKYTDFLHEWVRTAKLFVAPELEPTIMLLHNRDGQLFSDRSIIEVNVEWKGWPFETLYRFKRYLGVFDIIEEFDHFLYVDADMKFVGGVGTEVLPDNDSNGLIGVVHPGFYQPDRRGTFETQKGSVVYVNDFYRGTYYQGCVWGGARESVRTLCKTCDTWMNQDLLNGVFTTWWDEAYLNYYFMQNPPAVALNPGYAYPEQWDLPFPRRIIHIPKDADALRK